MLVELVEVEVVVSVVVVVVSEVVVVVSDVVVDVVLVPRIIQSRLFLQISKNVLYTCGTCRTST